LRVIYIWFDAGEAAFMVEQFVPLLLVISLALIFALLFLGLSYWLGPKKESKLKKTVYECGIPVRGGIEVRFFIRFFLVALLFLLFDLEAVFIYPWAVMYQSMLDGGRMIFALSEMGVFVGILVVGLVYVWKKGALEWQ
jgi:NADH-quinone oxidoreductase subunit A